MNLFVHNFSIMVTDECYRFHINIALVKTGGPRVDRWRKAYWAIFDTNYFSGKCWHRYAPRVGLRTPRYAAVAAFAGYDIYTTFLRDMVVRVGFGQAALSLAQAKLLRRA